MWKRIVERWWLPPVLWVWLFAAAPSGSLAQTGPPTFRAAVPEPRALSAAGPALPAGTPAFPAVAPGSAALPIAAPEPPALPGAAPGPAGLPVAAPGPAAAPSPPPAQATYVDPSSGSIVYRVHAASQRLEMTVNSSRILTTERKIPQAQVNNPDIVELTPLSPTEIQISAKAPGVTQVNLWDEQNNLTTVDVIVFGDARELEYVLRTQFPNATLKVVPVATGVLITGYVDRPEHVDLVKRIAEEYYPKVIDNITVGGVHQVLLHVKVMEVSRTKLRRLGFDWAKITGGNVVASTISGLITAATAGGVTTTSDATFSFGVVDGSSSFFGVLEALRQDNLAKVLAEPTLVTVSGRPAFFNVGGEIPVLVPQSLGSVSIEYKKYGTQLDFVPIVLGNGHIRLEVRPRVSEIDPSRTVTIGSVSVPGLRTREVETGVEMKAGQTLAIAGLVQLRSESENRGLPWVSDLPYVGAAFRRVDNRTNEIELLILVTPELVEAVDADQLPPCGPGLNSADPTDVDLYWKGFLEVPNCCPGGSGGGPGCASCATSMLSTEPTGPWETPAAEGLPGMIMAPGQSGPGVPPPEAAASARAGNAVRPPAAAAPARYSPPFARLFSSPTTAPGQRTAAPPMSTSAAGQAVSAPRPPSKGSAGSAEIVSGDYMSAPAHSPIVRHNPYVRPSGQSAVQAGPAASTNPTPGFIGPIGYDVLD